MINPVIDPQVWLFALVHFVALPALIMALFPLMVWLDQSNDRQA